MRAPKLLQPSPTAETIRPERPRLRCSNGMSPAPIAYPERQYREDLMQGTAGGAALLFGFNPFWVALAIFILAYLLIIAERINRSIIALLGAGVMVVSGVLSQAEAIRGIVFHAIALLTGMMVLV